MRARYDDIADFPQAGGSRNDLVEATDCLAKPLFATVQAFMRRSGELVRTGQDNPLSVPQVIEAQQRLWGDNRSYGNAGIHLAPYSASRGCLHRQSVDGGVIRHPPGEECPYLAASNWLRPSQLKELFTNGMAD